MEDLTSATGPELPTFRLVGQLDRVWMTGDDSLAAVEIEALYQAMNTVLRGAITTLMSRAKTTLGFEVRDFLQVHGKAGQPCPRCGLPISSVKSGIRVANFCRRCQT